MEGYIMSELDPQYRKAEEEAVVRVREDFSDLTFNVTSRETDLSGIDIENERRDIFIAVRSRFGDYRDVTFNGDQALRKIDKIRAQGGRYLIYLQYANGTTFSDPDFFIYQEQVIDFGKYLDSCSKTMPVAEAPTYYFLNRKQDSEGKTFYYLDILLLKDYIVDSRIFKKDEK
jgi:hypothetical protein